MGAKKNKPRHGGTRPAISSTRHELAGYATAAVRRCLLEKMIGAQIFSFVVDHHDGAATIGRKDDSKEVRQCNICC